MINKTQAKKEN